MGAMRARRSSMGAIPIGGLERCYLGAVRFELHVYCSHSGGCRVRHYAPTERAILAEREPLVSVPPGTANAQTRRGNPTRQRTIVVRHHRIRMQGSLSLLGVLPLPPPARRGSYASVSWPPRDPGGPRSALRLRDRLRTRPRLPPLPVPRPGSAARVGSGGGRTLPLLPGPQRTAVAKGEHPPQAPASEPVRVRSGVRSVLGVAWGEGGYEVPGGATGLPPTETPTFGAQDMSHVTA
mmetsp:Transcript_59131/g.139358  ORF Transcript_59131/g.139358 Transcript_59131/m.139358 type:complete len:237 (-) Transcript_59131:112-822(-)